MKLNRRVFSNAVFEHTIFTKLVFGGHSVGTFVKDNAVFHRFLVTNVNVPLRTISGRWLGMRPSDRFIDGIRFDQSFDLHNMNWKDESTLVTFYLTNVNLVHIPPVVQAEDELLIQQYGNPYALALR